MVTIQTRVCMAAPRQLIPQWHLLFASPKWDPLPLQGLDLSFHSSSAVPVLSAAHHQLQ